MKRKYTVDNPPRVYDLARAVNARDVRHSLHIYTGMPYKTYWTPSHRVPLSIAIGFISWYLKQ